MKVLSDYYVTSQTRIRGSSKEKEKSGEKLILF